MPGLTMVCAALVAFIGITSAQAPAATRAAARLERVEGIGGFFFRSSSPKILAQRYSNHLA
jgi:hypothetical protein